MTKFTRALHHVVVYLLCFIFILPLFWLLLASFKDSVQIYRFPPDLIPKPVVWQNYEVLFRDSTGINFFGYTLNSIIICSVAIFAAVFTNMLIAYGFARFKFKGKEILFLLILATMMIPGQLLWIPRYILFSNFGWVGTYLPILIPPLIGGNAVYIFFLRQFLRGIPMDYDEAAELDGCGPIRILFQIIAPMLKPGILFIVVSEFVGRWNDFMEPLIYLKRQSTYPLSLGLFQFQAKMQNLLVMKSQGEDPTGAFMAMCCLTLLPPLLLYIFFQKFYMEGVKLSGIKG